MTKILRPILSLILVLTALPLVLLFAPETSAGNGICHTEFTLSAPGSGSFVFQFEGQDIPGSPFSFAIADGESAGRNTPLDTTTVITEEPQDGYVFAGIECVTGTGVLINEIPGGFTIRLSEPGGRSGILRDNEYTDRETCPDAV